MNKLPLFVALDLDDQTQALNLVEQTKDYVLGYKLGPRLVLTYGTDLIQKIKSYDKNLKIFLDFKFYDIPSSTLSAVQSVFRVGADFVTVHSLVGKESLKLLSDFEKKANQERFFQILFVTVLSSESETAQTQERVLSLAEEVYQAGLKGFVCSPYEVQALREKYPSAWIVTPGIRLEKESQGDQKRVQKPLSALKAGSSALVMGRSLINSKNPTEVLKKLLKK